MRKEHFDSQAPCQVLVFTELLAIIEGGGMSLVWWQVLQQPFDLFAGAPRGAVLEFGCPEIAALAIDQRD